MGHETTCYIGEALRAKKLVTTENIDTALAQQKRCGSRLGSILMGQGSVNGYAVHQALAQQQGLMFVDLACEPCDATLLKETERQHYLEYRLIPWRQEGGRVLLAISDITPEAKAWAQQRYPQHGFVVTSPLDISRAVQQHFAVQDDTDARQLLWHHNAEKSAKDLFASGTEKSIFLLVVLAFFTLMVVDKLFMAVFIGLNVFYACTVLCKLVFFVTGWGVARSQQTPPELTLTEAELPLYTLLVPMYQEKRETIEQLLGAIRQLDYPKAKLDVKFIMEMDDTQTVAHARAAKPEAYVEIIRVPYSLPRTKPKACNYALKFARGEYVTIYDAEDRPDPQQLRKVLATFGASPENTACVQARLNYYNHSENILTRMFAIEYASWFNFMLPGLYQLGIPIPLGGTSNHFPTALLRKFYAWDPYNVTEDADLGIRIAHYGYRSAVVDSVTLEEAPVRLGGWLRQRSRWIKGYMQTFLVHMRKPKTLYRTLGKRGFIGFIFFVGAPSVVFLSIPFMLGISLMSLFVPLAVPSWFLYFAFGNFCFGIAVHIAIALVVCRYNYLKMNHFSFIFPFYWVLHSIASFKGLIQLITRPHYWEKTEHGLSRLKIAGSA